MSDENVYMRINHDWSVSYPAREQKEKEGKMNPCFLVYKANSQSTVANRELINIFSTEEKAKEYIDTLEDLSDKAGVYFDYEYEEWSIE